MEDIRLWRKKQATLEKDTKCDQTQCVSGGRPSDGDMCYLIETSDQTYEKWKFRNDRRFTLEWQANEQSVNSAN